LGFEDINDEDLMMLYKSGDTAAFRPLYDRHRNPLFRFVTRQISSRAIAEEIFQDVWLRLIKSASSYEVQAKFTSYLYRITHNRIIDHYRSNDRALMDQFDEERFRAEGESGDLTGVDGASMETSIDTIQISDQIHQEDLIKKLRLCLNKLPAPQREVFRLKEESGLSLAEIAMVVGCAAETAKSRYRYAVNKIRQDFKEAGSVRGSNSIRSAQNPEGQA